MLGEYDAGYKSCIDSMVRQMNDMQFRIDCLHAENAKLRELVAWMYRLMDESCAVQHTYAPEPIRYDTLLDVYEKLCELGIEVEG